MPELMDEELRAYRAEVFRHESEMVVVDPRGASGGTALGFVRDCVREAHVHCPVFLPPLVAILEMLNEHVAEWPERPVGEAVVVALDLRILQPDAPQGVGLIARGNAHASGVVAHFAICGAGA